MTILYALIIKLLQKKTHPDIIHKLGDIDVTGNGKYRQESDRCGNIGTDVGRIKIDLKNMMPESRQTQKPPTST